MHVPVEAGNYPTISAGLPVHLASRIISEARPDEVLVSSAVKAMCAGASLEFDDRGLIYLRMGLALATVEPFMDLNETWAYHRPGGPRVFHFAPVSKAGLRALADYRLLENLSDASGFTMPSERMALGGRRFAYLYQSRRVLDFLYEDDHFRRMDTRMRAAGDRFNPGFQGFLAWERQINEADARYAVSGVPDAPDLVAGIEFAYESLRFREVRDPGRPSLDRSLAIPFSDDFPRVPFTFFSAAGASSTAGGAIPLLASR